MSTSRVAAALRGRTALRVPIPTRTARPPVVAACEVYQHDAPSMVEMITYKDAHLDAGLDTRAFENDVEAVGQVERGQGSIYVIAHAPHGVLVFGVAFLVRWRGRR